MVIGAVLLLVGAGCSGTTSSGSSAQFDEEATRVEVQAAVNALVAAGEADDAEIAVQEFVSVSVDDGVTPYGVSGYFEVGSADIDWSASTWSNNNNTVALTSKDGITLGTWSKDASGAWKASSAFWFE